jgi:hypothetical protein
VSSSWCWWWWFSRVLPIVTNEDTFMLWAVSSWGRLGRYINCPHLCCNFRRKTLLWFFSLYPKLTAKSFAWEKMQTCNNYFLLWRLRSTWNDECSNICIMYSPKCTFLVPTYKIFKTYDTVWCLSIALGSHIYRVYHNTWHYN